MKCIFCGDDFELNQKGTGGRNRKSCYKCSPTNSDRHSRNIRRREMLSKFSSDMKRARGCDICGYNKCSAALEWHHKDNDKLNNPGNILNYSIERYKEEASKCILLCANCHRELHNDKYIGD